MRKINWGIIAAGSIAETFAAALAGSSTGQLLAVASRTQEKADGFGAKFKVPRCYGSYDSLLADRDVEAVYIATPHPMHAEWAIKAARAKKHILCEKPLTVNYRDAIEVIKAARENDVFLMEAFMYRCHPQTAKLVELLRRNTIGEIRVIRAFFGFNGGSDPESRLLNNKMAGGGILDVGCYCVSMSRMVAGLATGRNFAEPLEVKGCACIGKESRVDEWAVASLRFPGDITACLATGVRIPLDNSVQIFGSEGRISVPSPWLPGRDRGETTRIIVQKGDSAPEEIAVSTGQGLYSIEADVCAASIGKRQASFPAMSWDDTLGNMKTLDMWRESIGLRYDFEGN